jgi:hypothetical protein
VADTDDGDRGRNWARENGERRVQQKAAKETKDRGDRRDGETFLVVTLDTFMLRAMNGSQQQPDIRGKSQLIPALAQAVVVRCPGFRCLAYRDKDGRWRDVAHNEELPEILESLWEC